MNYLFPFVVMLLVACTTPEGNSVNEISASRITDVNTKNNDTITPSSTNGERTYTDSAHFHIIRGKYLSGARFIEVYENKLTRLDSWKEFYENGQLKKEGVMTTSTHYLVGIWKYYSPEGKLDSLIDYDQTKTVSYRMAEKIAVKNGYILDDVDITLHQDSNKTYWEVAHRTTKASTGGDRATPLLIDVKTGKTELADYFIIKL